jgi:hypothetical protein
LNISFVEPLSRAGERTRNMLFGPFVLVKWLVLGFSVWLANLANGGGWTWTRAMDDEDNGRQVSDIGEALDQLVANAVWIPVVLLLLTLALAFFLLLLWISSRAKFIFLDNVVHDRAQIVEPWNRLGRLGNSLFLWRFGFTMLVIGAVLVMLLIFFAPAASMSFSEALRALSFATIFLGIMVLMIFGVAVFFIALLMENFVIPIMYRYELKAMDAWRAFMPWFRSHGGWFVVYALLVLVGSVLFAALSMVVCLFTCCIVVIPYVGTVILLPVWVLYRIYSLEFLAQFHPDFDLFAAAALPPEQPI